MHDLAPQLTAAVAQRVSSSELHDAALRDLGAFVHRAVVEDERVYAVRIDDGALLDCHAQLPHARANLNDHGRRDAAAALGCAPDELDGELDQLAAKARHATLRVDQALRERARTGRYAYVHDRGADFAAGIWVIDPVFHDRRHPRDIRRPVRGPTARDESFFAGAGLDTRELRDAAEAERERRHEQRQRQLEAVRSNLRLERVLSPIPTRCAASPTSSPASPPRSCSIPTASPAQRSSAASA